jgi:hypothetical protein
VIRQAISCDICGTDKQQTNHWFVAYDQHGELRISDWNSQIRLRPGAKHLCGQICLHKLVDEFMAKAIAVRLPAAEKMLGQEKLARVAAKPAAAARIDASLTSVASHSLPPRPVAVPSESFVEDFADEYESSARLIKPETEGAADSAPTAPAFNSRTWRAEAWKRERERQQRTSRRRSIA